MKKKKKLGKPETQLFSHGRDSSVIQQNAILSYVGCYFEIDTSWSYSSKIQYLGTHLAVQFDPVQHVLTLKSMSRYTAV